MSDNPEAHKFFITPRMPNNWCKGTKILKRIMVTTILIQYNM